MTVGRSKVERIIDFIVYGFAGFCLGYFIVIGISKAHDDAEWIMKEPRYKDKNDIHCCGPTDCKKVDASEISETQSTVTHRNQSLFKNERGVYWSKDENYWVCRRIDGLKCIFIPMPGS